MTENQLITMLKHIQVVKWRAERAERRIKKAKAALEDMIDGADESRARDSDISHVIMILEGTEVYP